MVFDHLADDAIQQLQMGGCFAPFLRFCRVVQRGVELGQPVRRAIYLALVMEWHVGFMRLQAVILPDRH